MAIASSVDPAAIRRIARLYSADSKLGSCRSASRYAFSASKGRPAFCAWTPRLKMQNLFVVSNVRHF